MFVAGVLLIYHFRYERPTAGNYHEVKIAPSEDSKALVKEPGVVYADAESSTRNAMIEKMNEQTRVEKEQRETDPAAQAKDWQVKTTRHEADVYGHTDLQPMVPREQHSTTTTTTTTTKSTATVSKCASTYDVRNATMMKSTNSTK